MNVKEIKIPVLWGYVAAKAWGDEKDQHVISIHGYQDNANSFDKLIPLLPKSFYYVCIDLPSHGQSSHLPIVTFLGFHDFVVTLKFVLDQLNKRKYILLGHSFGAQVELMYTQMFPEYVLKLIMLDASYYLPMDPKKCINEYKICYQRYFKTLKHVGPAPLYTLDEAVQRMQDSRFAPISKESAEIIMRRSLNPSEVNGKYSISAPQYLKFILRPQLTLEYCAQLLENNPITCPHLIIFAEDSIIIETSKSLNKTFEKNKKFMMKIVKGDHDVHLDHPDRVAPIVTEFLLKNFDSKL